MESRNRKFLHEVGFCKNLCFKFVILTRVSFCRLVQWYNKVSEDAEFDDINITKEEEA